MKINKIKKQLKKESNTFVPDIKDQLYKNLGIDEKQVKKPFNFKPYLLIISTVFIMVLGIYFLFTNKQTVKYSNTIITIDINPSIELEIDKDEKVVNIRPLNYDAIILLDNKKDLINKDVFEVIDILIEKATDSEYTSNEHKVTINVVNEIEGIESRVRDKMLVHYSNKQNIKILTNEEYKEKARENNVSVGKMKLIDELMKKDPSITIEIAKKLSIKEINERIRNYKNDIKEDEEKFHNQLLIFNLKKEQARNTYLNNYQKAIKELEKIKKHRNKQHAKIQLKVLINKYLQSYEINDDKELKEVFKELEDELRKQKDFIDEIIDNHYKTQMNFYKEFIKKEGRNVIENYQFTGFSFIYDINNIYLNDEEKDLIVLVDALDIYLNHLAQKSDTDEYLHTNSDKMKDLIKEMLNSSNIREELKNSQFIQDLIN